MKQRTLLFPLAALFACPVVSAQDPCSNSAHVVTRGTGTGGTSGVPTLGVVGTPVVGESFALQVANGAPTAMGLLLF